MTKNAVAIDIMEFLQDEDLGTIGSDLFAMEWGQSVDEQILVLDTDGIESDLKATFEQPTFQVLVRGKPQTDARATHDKAREVYELLIQQSDSVTIKGTCYKGFEPMSGPAGVGRDTAGRMVYSMNFFTYRNPV